MQKPAPCRPVKRRRNRTCGNRKNTTHLKTPHAARQRCYSKNSPQRKAWERAEASTGRIVKAPLRPFLEGRGLSTSKILGAALGRYAHRSAAFARMTTGQAAG